MENTDKYEDWVAVFTTGTDYEADMVRDRLDSAGIPAVVLTQRDHAFNLTVGDLAAVRVMVRPADQEKARQILQDVISDEELEEAARVVGKDEEELTGDEPETMFDSGNERIHFSPPEEKGKEEDKKEDKAEKGPDKEE